MGGYDYYHTRCIKNRVPAPLQSYHIKTLSLPTCPIKHHDKLANLAASPNNKHNFTAIKSIKSINYARTKQGRHIKIKTNEGHSHTFTVAREDDHVSLLTSQRDNNLHQNTMNEKQATDDWIFVVGLGPEISSSSSSCTSTKHFFPNEGIAEDAEGWTLIGF